MELSQNAVESEKTKDQQKKEDGEMSEILFGQYLNNQGIPFYSIKQNKESQSDELKNRGLRRPDYIIHTKKDVFHVDVKNRNKRPYGLNNEERVYLNQFELRGLIELQKELNLNVWIAFAEEKNSTNFIYASISEIQEYYSYICNNINKCSEEIKKKFDVCFIYIPEQLIYSNLSYENGFYDRKKSYFSDSEIENYIEESKKVKNPNAIKRAHVKSYQNL